jgi:hypothetical protein
LSLVDLDTISMMAIRKEPDSGSTAIPRVIGFPSGFDSIG